MLATRVHRFLMSDPIEAVNRDFGQLMNRFFSEDTPVSAVYAADVKEDADHIYIEAELPGFRKEDVDVTLEKNVLTISAERKSETTIPAPVGEGQPALEGSSQTQPTPPTPQPEWLLRERQTASFQRSFRLPPTVSEGQVDAHFTDGVLYLTLNKREETKPRKIAIS